MHKFQMKTYKCGTKLPRTININHELTRTTVYSVYIPKRKMKCDNSFHGSGASISREIEHDYKL